MSGMTNVLSVVSAMSGMTNVLSVVSAMSGMTNVLSVVSAMSGMTNVLSVVSAMSGMTNVLSVVSAMSGMTNVLSVVSAMSGMTNVLSVVSAMSGMTNVLSVVSAMSGMTNVLSCLVLSCLCHCASLHSAAPIFPPAIKSITSQIPCNLPLTERITFRKLGFGLCFLKKNPVSITLNEFHLSILVFYEKCKKLELVPLACVNIKILSQVWGFPC